jgi:uncharacterized membrane protein YedE/YeeE
MKASNKQKPWMNSYIAGALLGVVLFISFYVTGSGLGASGTLSRVSVTIQDVVASDHVNTTPYLLKMAGGDKNPLAHWIIFLTLGSLIGGALSGWMSGRLKVETVKGEGVSDQKRWIFALVGGAIMGFGARFARGCTSGQALSGGSVLSVGSWAFMFAVFAGAFAVAWFVRNNWK